MCVPHFGTQERLGDNDQVFYSIYLCSYFTVTTSIFKTHADAKEFSYESVPRVIYDTLTITERRRQRRTEKKIHNLVSFRPAREEIAAVLERPDQNSRHGILAESRDGERHDGPGERWGAG